MVLHMFYFSFRWGPFVHSLRIVEWNPTRRDNPRDPGRVFGSGPVTYCDVSYSFRINGLGNPTII